MNEFTLREMILNGWPVLSVLLVMSILSVTVIIDRLLALRRARLNPQAFVSAVNRILDSQGEAGAAEYCEKFSQPLGVVALSAIRQKGDRQARERAAQHALQAQVNGLETFVPILGTIASTAPFVGLFGTVVGIVRAFRDIAVNLGGGPEVVAAGVAEALIATAFGLFVAIPAVMVYNFLVHRIRRLADAVDLAAYDVIEKLSEKKQ